MLTQAFQFSRYITTPSTTTATSEFEPPQGPPPPPPLNIPPSRARRQLAARLALHSKQSQGNGSTASADAEKEHTANLNPFAADEDDDEDEEESEDFTIGDLETEPEGNGILPPEAAMTGSAESLDERNLALKEDKDGELSIIDNVRTTSPAIVARLSVSSLWPFDRIPRHAKANRKKASELTNSGPDDENESTGCLSEADYKH